MAKGKKRWNCAARVDGKPAHVRTKVNLGMFTVTGDFGEVEGWLQLIDGATGPDGFGDAVAKGDAKLCGRDRDGDVFAR